VKSFSRELSTEAFTPTRTITCLQAFTIQPGAIVSEIQDDPG
jgi:hypothetical protein